MSWNVLSLFCIVFLPTLLLLCKNQEINKGVAGARQSPRPHVTLRHDTAALIALSKTRNQVQDRAALVHNEATIIFDERTAL